MKTVQVGDIHIIDNRAQEFSELLKDLSDKIDSLKPDLIVFTGDFFINRDVLTNSQVELCRRFLLDDLKVYKKLLAIGNHDATMSYYKMDAITALFKFEPNIFIGNKIGSYVNIGETEQNLTHRFHFLSYPSKYELQNVGIKDISELHSNDISKYFHLDQTKKNILIFHGTLDGFSMTETQQGLVDIGKDLTISKDFYTKFDIVMAGHLHKYQFQQVGKCLAVYNGCPFPLNFTDSYKTGFVFWENDKQFFIELKQKYPYTTVDLGSFELEDNLTEEALKRAEHSQDYKNHRIRIKYTVPSNRAKEIKNSDIAVLFKNAKEIKFAPTYISNKRELEISLGELHDYTTHELICKFVDDNNFNPEVKKISERVEKEVEKIKQYEDIDKNIHFRINSLSLKNFRSFGEENEVIDFTKLNAITCITGKNKCGKSSLIEALVWGLYGDTLRSKDATSILRNGQEEVTAEVELVSYNTLYKIKRTRKKKSTFLSFLKYDDKWIDISEATVKETQQAIEKIVGTLAIFSSTGYSAQGDIDEIVYKKPSERKQTIIECMQIDILERRQKVIASLKQLGKEKLDIEKGRATVFAEQINNIDNLNPESMLKDFENLLQGIKEEDIKLNDELDLASKELSDTKTSGDNLNSLFCERNKLNTELTKLNHTINSKIKEQNDLSSLLSNEKLIKNGLAKLKELEQKASDFAQVYNKQVQLKEKLGHLSVQLTALKTNYVKAKTALEDSQKDILQSIDGLHLLDCPKPDCPINKAIQEQIQAQEEILLVNKEKIAKLELAFADDISVQESLIKDVEAELKNIVYDQNEVNKCSDALKIERDKNWTEAYNKCLGGDAVLKVLKELIESLNADKKVILDKLEECKERERDLNLKMYKFKQTEAKVSQLKMKIDKNKTTIDNYNNQIYRYQNFLVKREELKKTLEETKNNINKIEEYLVFCNQYSTIVNKDGLLYQLVDQALPIIESFAQDLLNEATDGMLSINIDSFRMLSDKKTKEEIIINISDAKGRRDIIEGSGAEKVIVSLALRAAMAHLLSLKMGSKVELFILDEGFGVFDSEVLNGVKKIIKILGTKFNKVMLITHVKELHDVAESLIEVSSNGIISTYNIRYDLEK